LFDGYPAPPKKGPKTPTLAETAKRWQIGPYIVGQTVQVGPHIVLKLNRKPVLVLCGFRHISTYGLGVGASLASFMSVLGALCKYRSVLCYGNVVLSVTLVFNSNGSMD